MTELETALLSISHKLGTTPSAVEPEDSAVQAPQQARSGLLLSKPVASTDSDPETLLKHAPVLSLFDNAILSRQPNEITNGDSYDRTLLKPNANISNPKLENARQNLLSLFPPQRRLEAILSGSHSWWSGLQDLYPQILGYGSFCDPIRFVADLRSSESVQKITKALLCLFVILQEVHADLYTSTDTAITGGQKRQALGIIDEMVLNDDEIAGTLDGIECLYLRAKYEIDDGHIHKAWLIFRRGISFAQLSGFHKGLSDPANETSQSIRRNSLWKAFYAGDRFLSLTLGLPYGPSEIHSNIGRDSEACAKGIHAQDTREHYFYRLSNIMGHIIDRNQQLPSNNMLMLTYKIDAELLELAESMTDDWWKSDFETSTVSNFLYSHLLPQFCHHQARSLLHLPFMLKATTDRRFEYSRNAALESAREMVVRYRVIRPAQGFGSHTCKVIDFQIFTAAMILVLNLLDHYGKAETLDSSEADKDQDLISETTNILHRASVETDGGVATQAARALDIFGKVKEMFWNSGEECSGVTKVVIPYLGTVAFEPGMRLKEQVRKQRSESQAQIQQMPTPSDQSLDDSTPETALTGNPVIEPNMPFTFSYGEGSQGGGVNGDFLANVNLDIDQDWSWFWNNTDIPSADSQGAAT